MRVQKTNKLDNGDVIVTISFDVTRHGHYFGVPRNYDIGKITKLIRSKSVQETVNNGYALGLYGHNKRHLTARHPYAREQDEAGNEVFPVAKTIALSIKGNIITHTQHVINTSKSDFIIRYIESGFGGFSFVWRVKDNEFYGADYVLSPNFTENRGEPLVSCSDGSCRVSAVSADSIIEELSRNGENIEEVKRDLLLLDGIIPYDQAVKSTEVDDSSFYQAEISSLDKEVETLTDEVEALKEQLLAKDTEYDAIFENSPLNRDMSFNLDSLGDLIVRDTTPHTPLELDSIMEEFKSNEINKNRTLTTSEKNEISQLGKR